MTKASKSILFVRPDYHCSFIYRDEFRKRGWKADIFVEENYPKKLLYSDSDILQPIAFKNKNFKFLKYLNVIILFIWWHFIFWRYKTHIYYGRPPILTGSEYLTKIKKNFIWELWLAKIFKIKLIYVPTGCLDHDLKSTWLSFDNGNVCNNCGFFDRCDDKKNKANFNVINKYFDFSIGFGEKKSKEIREKILKYKVIDLNLWHPTLKVPDEFLLPNTNKLRILHSNFLDNSNRNWNKRNIKGSKYIYEAIEKLKIEGFEIEYIQLNNVDSKNIRFYQSQADIIIDQLIYGWWGSTFVEASALGKPVIIYLRKEWKTFFKSNFPEYKNHKFLEANQKTIYSVLKKLISNKKFRLKKGLDSRIFAKKHFDPKINTKSLEKTIEWI